MALALRDYDVFRGTPDHLPEPMGAALARLEVAPEILRVAKIDDLVIGCYAMHAPSAWVHAADEQCYRLALVMVADAYRNNGVGRWLIGHAIGVAETKGGRQLLAPLPHPARFFLKLGFRQTGDGFSFSMYPE